MKVLICDPISVVAITLLQKRGFDILYKPEISPIELMKLIPDINYLLVKSRTKVSKDILDKGKNLKAVGRVGSGFDNIDIEECKKRKITVINAPAANANAVAELTIMLIIELLRKIEQANISMRKGLWMKGDLLGQELSGKTVGIIGFGFIGSRVAEILKAFKCKLLIYSLNYNNCELEELFAKADIITLHLTLTKSTRNLINRKLLSKMKQTAILINISRGEIINEDDLYEILVNKRISGAALDVFWSEPLPEKSKWRKLSNIVLTPHLGAATTDALDKASRSIADDLIRIKNNKIPKFKII